MVHTSPLNPLAVLGTILAVPLCLCGGLSKHLNLCCTAGDSLSVPVSDVQLSRPEKLSGSQIVMLPLTDFARMLSGREPVYEGIVREMDPTEPVFADMRTGLIVVFVVAEGFSEEGGGVSFRTYMVALMGEDLVIRTQEEAWFSSSERSGRSYTGGLVSGAEAPIASVFLMVALGQSM